MVTDIYKCGCGAWSRKDYTLQNNCPICDSIMHPSSRECKKITFIPIEVIVKKEYWDRSEPVRRHCHVPMGYDSGNWRRGKTVGLV